MELVHVQEVAVETPLMTCLCSVPYQHPASAPCPVTDPISQLEVTVSCTAVPWSPPSSRLFQNTLDF